MSEAQGRAPAERPELEVSNASGALFLCEDSEDDEFWFRKTFKKAGLSVPIHVAPTVRQAIEYLQGCCAAGQNMPRLMVMDFRLADGKCLEILDFVRSQPGLRHIPIITYSGGLNTEDLQSTANYGVVACIEKPLTVEHVDRFRSFFG
jgi:CheY-like chemotaxis protein